MSHGLQMAKRFSDLRPSILQSKVVLRTVRLGPGVSLVLTMLYFGIVYLLFYISHSSHPLLTASLGARSIFGFEPVNSSAVLHECAAINGPTPSCPPNTSDYYQAVLLSYLSPLYNTEPELSVTHILMGPSAFSFLSWGRWRRFCASTMRGLVTRIRSLLSDFRNSSWI